MPRWLSVALLIALPCLTALLAYDAVAVFLLRHDQYRLNPGRDLARAFLQDLGLVAVYAVSVTPRILPTVPETVSRTTAFSLIMLGLGIAWYDVLSAFISRMLPDPPGFAISLVVLFVVPVLLAPRYLRWVQAKANGR
jgi:hypothetical protein